MEAQKYFGELAAFQEKYRYDIKFYIEKEDHYKTREKNLEKRVQALQSENKNMGDYQREFRKY